MAKPSQRKRGRKTRTLLLGKGLTAVLLGVGMLTASAVLGGSSPMKAAVSTALSMPAWWAIGIGLALIIAHGVAFRRQRGRERQALVDAQPKHAARPDPDTIRALIDQAERAFAFSQIDPSPEDAADTEANANSAKRQAPGSRWGPAVFAVIEWRRFEAVCEALFGQAGFETRSQSHGADGGVDIWLHSRHAQGPVAVVQCKHWQGKPVGVQEMREFVGLMASHGLKRGTYATTSTYTPEAQDFARDNGINALSGPGLLALIKQRTPEQQTNLLAIAFEGEYWRPTCATCGVKMVNRSPKNGGRAIWSCIHFPRCQHTMHKRIGPLPH
ncbi:hypothetical protein LPB72_03310 [Hydrogenophaga crassostreae]|uniref:Restriction endonuclease type IV Mrr domain-containing protein n=1 Tax=Hydrogenophaga crassostreae TaxID=1763535 RepID=A0A167ITN3_9BURK|nr:restriction endonuclease [Hydrogenophaga crassostreae]AOW14399.1 hypothetical protein LPB072_17725 [Hydrogenophaga crassostreae]OAD43576.1 hypothetical protein LPB72_03310 [Hydrogenophaga crassostreae]